MSDDKASETEKTDSFSKSVLERMVIWWGSVCILHQWDKWQVYEEKGIAYPGLLCRGLPKTGVRYSDTRQRRTCKSCGVSQDKLVRESL